MNEQRRIRVAILEDCEKLARVTARFLEMKGYKCEAAHSGESGMELVRSFMPQVVLCNLELGGRMSGCDVAEEISRSIEPKPLLVAVTSDGMAEDFERTKQAGFDRHLVKPVSGEHLLETVAAAPARC